MEYARTAGLVDRVLQSCRSCPLTDSHYVDVSTRILRKDAIDSPREWMEPSCSVSKGVGASTISRDAVRIGAALLTTSAGHSFSVWPKLHKPKPRVGLLVGGQVHPSHMFVCHRTQQR